jgi:hypothetical protein
MVARDRLDGHEGIAPRDDLADLGALLSMWAIEFPP